MDAGRGTYRFWAIFAFQKAEIERAGFRRRKSKEKDRSGNIHHVTPPPRGHKGGGGVL
jgi:hypothetical protein